MRRGLKREFRAMLVSALICSNKDCVGSILSCEEGLLETDSIFGKVVAKFYTIREKDTQVPIMDIYPLHDCAVIGRLENSTLDTNDFVQYMKEALFVVHPKMILLSEQGTMTDEGLNKLVDILNNDTGKDKRAFYKKMYDMHVWNINISSLWDNCGTESSKLNFLNFFEFKV